MGVQDGVPFMREKGYRLCATLGTVYAWITLLKLRAYPQAVILGVPFMRAVATSVYRPAAIAE